MPSTKLWSMGGLTDLGANLERAVRDDRRALPPPVLETVEPNVENDDEN